MEETKREEILKQLEEIKLARSKRITDDAAPVMPGNFATYFLTADCCTTSSNT